MTENAPASATLDVNSRLSMVVDIVSAFVGNNRVTQEELMQLIKGVDGAIDQLGRKSSEPEPIAPTPKVPVKKSITPEYIYCLEDGLKFRSLKRHLRSKYNMSPDQYRARWGLPPDYPMVAPAYSAQRSQLAKSAGLGQLRSAALAKKKPRKATPRANKA